VTPTGAAGQDTNKRADTGNLGASVFWKGEGEQLGMWEKGGWTGCSKTWNMEGGGYSGRRWPISGSGGEVGQAPRMPSSCDQEVEMLKLDSVQNGELLDALGVLRWWARRRCGGAVDVRSSVQASVLHADDFGGGSLKGAPVQID
jgi:hypothetical protein